MTDKNNDIYYYTHENGEWLSFPDGGVLVAEGKVVYVDMTDRQVWIIDND